MYLNSLLKAHFKQSKTTAEESRHLAAIPRGWMGKPWHAGWWWGRQSADVGRSAVVGSRGSLRGPTTFHRPLSRSDADVANCTNHCAHLWLATPSTRSRDVTRNHRSTRHSWGNCACDAVIHVHGSMSLARPFLYQRNILGYNVILYSFSVIR